MAKNARTIFAEGKVGAIMTASAHGWVVDETIPGEFPRKSDGVRERDLWDIIQFAMKPRLWVSRLH